MGAVLREWSAGGVVLRRGKVLMVRVRNLLGRTVWTFPKGHLEKGETPVRAALREVLEETGWRCALAGAGRRFHRARYGFNRGPRPVRKEVFWYRMRALRRTGRRDPEEILKVGWFSPSAARETVSYPSDRRLLELLEAVRRR
ncbi:MAG: hypothetical protein A2902_02245 [Elusimicrobia bacterium RIFCSPLOWO2_01_FULL_64_13]|nr:MAG: hypothetical protein A2636_07120 [Elusimicrobia bacterium RIFCSPHIGHO2_01_FULL_64_10]OGR94372.1 MAG: hypothetical protein A2902_02245 [Elusimicrobia bacterium RIFCSPLOWO2_01_FULL_64_13]